MSKNQLKINNYKSPDKSDGFLVSHELITGCKAFSGTKPQLIYETESIFMKKPIVILNSSDKLLISPASILDNN